MSVQFGLGVLSISGDSKFTALVVGDRILKLDQLVAAQNGQLRPGARPEDLVEDWDRNFDQLQALAEFAMGEGQAITAVDRASVRFHPPFPRPGKMLHSAANYRDHVKEMAAYNIAAGADPDKRFSGDKTDAQPYLFLKASSTLAGAFDDIVLPDGQHQIDWEVELALVIGRTARRVTAERALLHVAGYMATNDVTCRDMLFRPDRPNFKTDWLASKSHDGFAPMGPLFIPAAFVADPGTLHLTLSVNGVNKQTGNTSEMIFSAQEQIAFASSFMTLQAGDIFATGTVGGVGQATGEFLKAGDVVETEVHGVGRLLNKVVAAQ